MTIDVTYYPTPVTYEKPTIKRLLAVFRGAVDRDFNDAVFKQIPECSGLIGTDGVLELGLIHPDRYIPERTAVEELASLGYRPRLFEEQVCFAEKYLDLIHFPVFALGSKTGEKTNPNYACIWGSDAHAHRPLTLLKGVRGFSKDCRILVTPL